MSDLIGNPENRFSWDGAHLVSSKCMMKLTCSTVPFRLPLLGTGLLLIFGIHHMHDEIDPSFHYGIDQVSLFQSLKNTFKCSARRLVYLMFNVPVNNFSVMLGRSHHFLGITSTFGV